ncbi:CRISPR-associated helicase Cas3' [Aeromicrobium sp. 179-A 4D2 NHS]|uniref:CRISPR-associated helicase Cas3' n=1 Tax=Aeromicrobium sp. 179-A 4D2 NHS TaxID=3142375 RepID=UPI0039A0B6EE
MTTFTMSDAALSVWAKTNKLGQYGLDGNRLPATDTRLHWLPLHQHLKDAGDAAAKIWDDWLPKVTRELITSALPDSIPETDRETTARAIGIFLAASHDVGKATPCFAVMNDTLATEMHRHDLVIEADLNVRSPERKTLMHALASHFALSDWMTSGDPTGRDYDTSWLGYILGGHHGRHGTERLDSLAATDRLYGPDEWEHVRDEHLERALYLADLDFETLIAVSVNPPSQQVQVLYSALVVYADWLASATDLFPLYLHQPGVLPPAQNRDDTTRSDPAWIRLGSVPPPWAPSLACCEDADTMFASRFVPGRDAKARPVQQAAYDAANECDPASLLIIEAPMGEGKTEAGLMAAEILAHRSGAGGIMMAMPTQVTTDRMFDRIIDWLNNSSESLDDHGKHTVSLVHSKASYNQRLETLRLPDATLAEDDQHAFAHVWLTGRKTGLANFVVATVDQLLMMALAGRNIPMRHFGIAGKVVIIDEAHAYDAFMNRYMDVVLEYLGSYNIPVVMLSATLPVHTRQDFIDAYVRGQSGNPEKNPLVQTDLKITPAYPAITWFSHEGKGMHKAAPVSPKVQVKIGRWNENDHQMARRLDALLRKNGQPSGRALIIRNTVKGAQETYRNLREHFGDAVQLMHARFTDGDRLERDARISTMFGEGNAADTSLQILVSTQVVEQSLDVDFDMLVTDVAPTDVLFQRMGRIHRHRARDGHRPDRLTTPLAVLRHANWRVDDVLKLGEAGASSSFIYEHMLIYRAMLQFRNRATVSLPGDIAKMVHVAYMWEIESFRPEEDPLIKRNAKYAGIVKWAWLQARTHREEARARAAAFLIHSVTQRADFGNLALLEGFLYNELGGQALDASVRDSLMPTEVILLDCIDADDEPEFFLPSASSFGPDLKAIPITPGQPITDDALREAVNACSLRIPAHVFNRSDSGGLKIRHQFHPGWTDSFNAGPLSGKPVVWLDTREHAAQFVAYDREIGAIVS